MEDYTKSIIDEYGNINFYNSKGQLHRNGAAAIEYSSGTKEWYLNGKCHRVNGPAVEYHNGAKEWCVYGQCHRLNGPAVEYAYRGGKEWYLKNKMYSKSCHNRLHLFSVLEPRRIDLNPTDEE